MSEYRINKNKKSLRKLFKLEEDEPFIIKEETIYDEDSRDRMLENDEISPWESAFMQGWDRAGDDMIT